MDLNVFTSKVEFLFGLEITILIDLHIDVVAVWFKSTSFCDQLSIPATRESFRLLYFSSLYTWALSLSIHIFKITKYICIEHARLAFLTKIFIIILTTNSLAV